MGNLNDFDLDLRKFAQNTEGEGRVDTGDIVSITTSITTIPSQLLSLYSVEKCGEPSNAAIPTTAMTVNCCTKEGGNVPNCV